MVWKTAKNGLRWQQPPYTRQELFEIERQDNTPIGMAGGSRRAATTNKDHPVQDKQPPSEGQIESVAAVVKPGDPKRP